MFITYSFDSYIECTNLRYPDFLVIVSRIRKNPKIKRLIYDYECLFISNKEIHRSIIDQDRFDKYMSYKCFEDIFDTYEELIEFLISQDAIEEK